MIHELEEPELPNYNEDVFTGLGSVVNEAALDGYRRYAREELEKGMIPLKKMTEEALTELDKMHVTDIVCQLIIFSL